jgi:hypothetical protein
MQTEGTTYNQLLFLTNNMPVYTDVTNLIYNLGYKFVSSSFRTTKTMWILWPIETMNFVWSTETLSAWATSPASRWLLHNKLLCYTTPRLCSRPILSWPGFCCILSYSGILIMHVGLVCAPWRLLFAQASIILHLCYKMSQVL